MTDRVLQPRVHEDGSITVTAAIRVRMPDPLGLRTRVALPHENEDGELGPHSREAPRGTH